MVVVPSGSLPGGSGSLWRNLVPSVGFLGGSLCFSGIFFLHSVDGVGCGGFGFLLESSWGFLWSSGGFWSLLVPSEVL